MRAHRHGVPDSNDRRLRAYVRGGSGCVSFADVISCQRRLRANQSLQQIDHKVGSLTELLVIWTETRTPHLMRMNLNIDW